jgi:hypothetical protein
VATDLNAPSWTSDGKGLLIDRYDDGSYINWRPAQPQIRIGSARPIESSVIAIVAVSRPRRDSHSQRPRDPGLIRLYGRPTRLREHNGPELLAAAFEEWCVRPSGSAFNLGPDQNALIERFNRTYREEYSTLSGPMTRPSTARCPSCRDPTCLRSLRSRCLLDGKLTGLQPVPETTVPLFQSLVAARLRQTFIRRPRVWFPLFSAFYATVRLANGLFSATNRQSLSSPFLG